MTLKEINENWILDVDRIYELKLVDLSIDEVVEFAVFINEDSIRFFDKEKAFACFYSIKMQLDIKRSSRRPSL